MRFGAFIDSAGGTEKVLCMMANYFVEHGHDVAIVCCEEKDGRPFFYLNQNVKLVNLNASGKVIKGKPILRIKKELLKIFGKYDSDKKDEIYLKERYDNIIKEKFFKLIDDENPDIIITFDYWSLLFLKNIVKSSIKTVAMLHNNVVTYFNENMSKIGLDAFRQVEFIQVLNKDAISVVKKYLSDANIIYIPNAIENHCIVNKKYNNKKIVIIGALTKSIKRPHIAIQSFAQLHKEFPEWKMELLGGTHDAKQEKYKKTLLDFVEKNDLSDRVCFLGVRKDIWIELQSADILAFPSKTEGFPLALIEAMSVGVVPIAFSYCSTVNKLIRNGINGFLCENEDDFTDKMRVLMNDSDLRRKMGNAAKDSVQCYSTNSVYGKWEDLLYNIVYGD